MIETNHEFEIKLLFPLNRFKAIEQFIVSKGGTRRQHLQAAYIDTSDFQLSKAGIALRVRKEGRQWLQTLKIATSNSLDRIEHNVVLSSQKSLLPHWSISHHQGHPAGELLTKLIPDLSNEKLRIQYQTDIWRRKVKVKTVYGMLEYALDEGVIFTKQPNQVRSELVHELEIELMAGHPESVLSHAKAMVKRFKAYIDTRSKSERGYLLASNIEVSPLRRAVAIRNTKQSPHTQIFNPAFDDCLEQILNNQNVINMGYVHYDDYIHQLRVGIRRLKTFFKFLTPYEIVLTNEGSNALEEIFKKLGKYRDNSFISQILNPTILSLNGPPIILESKENLPHPNIICKDSSFQLLLLEIMSLRFQDFFLPNDIKENINFLSHTKKLVFKKMNKAYYFCANQAAELNGLEDEAVHVLRKKLKFLRYSLEFFRDFCVPSKFKLFFKALTQTLDHLGQFNDICVAIRRIEPLSESNSQFLFALGWLKAERKRTRDLCEISLIDLFQIKPPWKNS
jgi:inorganic triphosphatase YgiF